jgi:radical S-adenosyl methionine domain-containing protein 2
MSVARFAHVCCAVRACLLRAHRRHAEENHFSNRKRAFFESATCKELFSRQQNMFQRSARITANWHLVKTCNYKCTFCFAHFEKASPFLSLNESTAVLQELASNNVYKVNFAGGEPLMHPDLHALVSATVSLGMKASIISNASLMTTSFFKNTAPLLSQVGISCDSLRENVNVAIGRGYGSHVAIVRRSYKRLTEHAPKCRRKMNTVVMRHNKDEDFSGFLAENCIERWKVFKVLRIQGENEQAYGDLSISDVEFQEFVRRHRATPIVAENNDAMTSSYIMIDPEGRAYQNSQGKYNTGTRIYRTSLNESLAAAGGFDIDKYNARDGAYSL